MQLKIPIILVLLATQLATLSQEVYRYNLNTGWTLHDEKGGKTYAATIPGSVQTELIDAGVLADPFVGTNEQSALWVAESDWTYKSKSFHIDAGEGEIFFTFSGVDTYASVLLNGQNILECDNYFRNYEVNVTSFLEDQNELIIQLRSPITSVTEKLAERKFELPGEQLRAVTRKPQFHYGWDWAPKVIPMGIEQAIMVTEVPLAQIKNVYYRQDLVTDTLAIVSPVVDVEIFTAGEYELNLQVGEEEKTLNLPLNPGRFTVYFPLEIQNPRLWWCRGYGPQSQYQASVKITQGETIVDSDSENIGLRHIELITREQGVGQPFKFRLNGQDIFAKGANYIPQDIFQHRVSHNDYERVLEQAVLANMNMLRVWGGGLYEEDYFYELCDSLGIMIWQDFMYACAMYPGDSDFLDNAKTEAEEAVKRLRNHACISLWCGNNENSEGWHRWGWQDNLKYFQKRKVWRDYKALFQKILPDVVAQNSGTPYWESSPKLGRGDENHQYEGDAHYWGVWHDAEPFEVLAEKVPRFMSEFGFQSFPDMHIWRQVTEDDLDLNHEAVLSHEKHPRGLKLIREYMERWYGMVPNDFASFIQLSQILQAEGIGFGLEAHRRAQGWCMGTLYWQLNDCWPVVSWSSLDSDERWKAMHYKARDAFAPLLLSMEKDAVNVSVYAVIEKLPTPQQVTFEYEVLDMFGDAIDGGRLDVTVNEGSNLITSLAIKDLTQDIEVEDMVLLCRIYRPPLSKGGAERAFILDVPKNMNFEKEEINVATRVEGGEIKIELSCDVFCKNVILTSDQPGHFSDNYFDLVPGQTLRLTFVGEGKAAPRISVTSLNELLQK